MRALAGVPAAHRGDPFTSHEAAVAVTESGVRLTQARQVYDLVVAWPGRTAGELAGSPGIGFIGDPFLDRVQVARRLYDLKGLGLVRQGATRRCEVARRSCVTWWPAEPTQARQLDLWS